MIDYIDLPTPWLVRRVRRLLARRRPPGGWLPVALLLALVSVVERAVAATGWLDDTRPVAVATYSGLALALLLAARRTRPRRAAGLLAAYGVVVSVALVSRAVPPVGQLLSGWDVAAAWLRQALLLFADRLVGWWLAVVRGGSSQETLPFALALALLGWGSAAHAAWAVVRRRSAPAAVVPLALALGAVLYFSRVRHDVVALFIGAVGALTAATHYAALEDDWRARSVDFSREIRLELVGVVAGLTLLIGGAAYLVPRVPVTPVARAFAAWPPVQRADAALQRALAGVGIGGRGEDGRLDGPGGRGVLPRAFLLGAPPELLETVMFTAMVTFTATVTADDVPGVNWRAVTYDVYTGRGWARSAERREPIAAGQPLPGGVAPGHTVVTQTVTWVGDSRITRYTLGDPRAFDHDTVAFQRGSDDLVRVTGEPTRYVALSHVVRPSADRLRAASADGVPDVIRARYTALPALPPRIADLARTLTADAPTAYDQARAIEHFLRQYPYSLDVPPPPRRSDPVDYFLFDLQAGYCDYFAGAMVVLARSVGLPARLAIGYLAQPPDAVGVQTMRGVDAHSWPEIYFAGVGWVAFEPTPPFAPPVAEEGDSAESAPPITPDAPLPRRAPAWPRLLAPLLLLLALATAALLARARRRGPALPDGVAGPYARLVAAAAALGIPVQPSQTPYEMAALVRRHVAAWPQPRLRAWAQPLVVAAGRMADLLVAAHFRRRPDPAEADTAAEAAEARALWRRLRRPLWRVRVGQRVLGWFGRIPGSNQPPNAL